LEHRSLALRAIHSQAAIAEM